MMKRATLVAVLAVLAAVGFLAAAALSAPPGHGQGTNNGDTDPAASCPPGYGGDPCIKNGNVSPGTTKGHGNCEDNQGKGNNGNDNGNDRNGCAQTTTQPSTTTTTQPHTTTAHTTTTAFSTSTSGSSPGSTSTVPPTPPSTSHAGATTRPSTTTPAPAPSPATTPKHSTVHLIPPAQRRLVTHPAKQPIGLPFTGLGLWKWLLAALVALGTGFFLVRLLR
jgi:hypothetical protein